MFAEPFWECNRRNREPSHFNEIVGKNDQSSVAISGNDVREKLLREGLHYLQIVHSNTAHFAFLVGTLLACVNLEFIATQMVQLGSIDCSKRGMNGTHS